MIGIANHAKNVFVGTGGKQSIDRSHFLGAVCGMAKVCGGSSRGSGVRGSKPKRGGASASALQRATHVRLHVVQADAPVIAKLVQPMHKALQIRIVRHRIETVPVRLRQLY